ncbi:MAG TPA: YeeE/YedE thiosulfate transporter family protein [Polyangiaceae bacterium]|nr:YeeE/YedE thiosulfate transporter family protein [Polyangiaceae bacterium]
MIDSWLVRGAVGGALIGLSASLMLVLNGRVTGISGILNGLMRPSEKAEAGWRALFVLGLIVGGALTLRALGNDATPPPLATALLAGALVGVGTRIGNGCTSGHGVCGLSRLSPRSLAATLTFIATGALAVLATGGAGGAP